jgi:hypothetical protein
MGVQMGEVCGIEDLDQISYWLKERYTKGLPLKYIKVRINCSSEKEGLEELWKKYVEEVHLEIFVPCTYERHCLVLG